MGAGRTGQERSHAGEGDAGLSLNVVNTAFSQLWREFGSALSDLIGRIGEMIGVGLDFTVIETNFPRIPAVGTSAEVINDPGRWRIKPGADPS